jgi:thiol:disulfide interchange protein DsbD
MNRFTTRTMYIIVLLAGITAASGPLTLDLGKLRGPQTPAEEPVKVETREVGSPDDSLLEIEITLQMASFVHIYSAESLFFKIAETAIVGMGSSTITLPTPSAYTNFDGTAVSVFTNGQSFRISKPIVDSPWAFTGYIQYQACDTSKCFLPAKRFFRFSSAGFNDSAATGSVTPAVHPTDSWQTLVTRYTIAGASGGYQPSERFLAFLDNPGATRDAAGFAGKSILLIILLTLLGGIALNATPCVLPMIPITLAVIGAGSAAGSRKRGFFIGGLYGLGMALTYGVLGLVVALTGTQFGVINSSPVFNLVIAAVFIILSLGMFDIVHIDFTKYRSGIRSDSKKRGTALGVFFMGILAALLAGACVAPVVISVVLYAASLYAAGQPLGLLLPFLLGAGMALPWPFAGAGIAFLPKPGRWMVWVRSIFGVLILIMAIYYGYTGVSLMRTTPPAHSSGNTEQVWGASLEEGLNRGLTEKRPVIIDFWATWCKNCSAMDATTFRDSAVVQRLDRFIRVKYQAENPDDPATRQLLGYFGVIGLPTYVVLTPRE